MMPDLKLILLLEPLRSSNEFILSTGTLSVEAVASQQAIERLLSDRVMFNLGWHAARVSTVSELQGQAATDNLISQLSESNEFARDLAQATSQVMAASKSSKAMNKCGRKKGVYKPWHFETGYTVVLAAIETHPNVKVSDHIRWGVTHKWLSKTIPDRTHRRRIDLIRERHQLEYRARLAPLQ